MVRNESITPCCVSFNKDLTLGNIKHMTIHEAWHSKKMQEIREIHKKANITKIKLARLCRSYLS